jgi:putative transposase
MVSRPEAYPWSSYQSKVGIRSLKWLDYDSCYMELDSSRENREKKYEQWVNAVIPQGRMGIDTGIASTGTVDRQQKICRPN